MRNGETGEVRVAICEPRDAADVVNAVNEWTNLQQEIRDDRPHATRSEQLTFTTVKSQLGSILFVRLMRARGTIQSFTGGGFG